LPGSLQRSHPLAELRGGEENAREKKKRERDRDWKGAPQRFLQVGVYFPS